MSASASLSAAQQDPTSRQNTNNNGAESAAKQAGYENTRYDGTTTGAEHYGENENNTPVGETNESGIYNKKPVNPGFEG
jgi:hypothetical protein